MKKIKFNSHLFEIIPDPKDENSSFIFNKENGDIFQVEDITKKFILEINSKVQEKDRIIAKYIKNYNMDKKFSNDFKQVLKEMQKTKVIINI